MTSAADPGAPRRVPVVAAVVLLAILAAQIVAGARMMSASSDEVTHLPAGYTYLVTGDLRLNPQHPPLVKLLCAVPLLAIRPPLDLDDPAWTADPPREWEFGERFLYRDDPDRLLFLGRLPVAALALLLAWTVSRWAAELFGRRAGIAALVLAAFSPTLIAHARFVTMDVAVACFSTAFLHRLWRLSRTGRTADGAAASVALGLALSSKFSALVLVPALAVLAPLAVAPGGTPRRRALRGLALAAGILAGAAAVVWAAYLFPTDPSFYLDGIRRVNADHDPDRAYYLFGSFRVGGWWWYFPAAFLVKTPVPTLLLLGATALPRVRRAVPFPDRVSAAFVAVPALSWTVATCALADDLGVRYLLPVYPLAFLLAARAAAAAWRPPSPRIARVALAVLAAGYVGSAAWTFPDQLAYFNAASGGTARGWRLLDDSNLDWGQDLKRLSAWLDEHRTGEVHLLYPWIGRPERYGIRYRRMEPRDWYGPPRPGTYVVATVWLIRGLHEAGTRGTPTDWLVRYEPVGRIGSSFFVYRFGPADGGGPRSP